MEERLVLMLTVPLNGEALPATLQPVRHLAGQSGQVVLYRVHIQVVHAKLLVDRIRLEHRLL